MKLLAINRSLSFRHNWWGLIALSVICLAISACEKSAQDKLRDGRAALAAQNAELAESHFQEVLKLEPGMVEARRLMADVYMLKADFQKAEDSLEALWKEQGFDTDRQPSDTEARLRRQLMNEQFNELYRRWAEALQDKDHPSKLEEVLTKGLERNPRSPRLNTLLVEFYESQGERYIQRGDKLKAAQMFEKVTTLRTFAERRTEARQRAQNLRQEAFEEAGRKRFQESLQAELEEAERYNAETDTVLVTIEADVDRRLNPRNEEHAQHARNLASRELVTPLAQLAIAISGLAEDADFTGMASPRMDIVQENFQRGQFTLVISVPVNELIKMGFRYQQAQDAASDDTDDTVKSDEGSPDAEDSVAAQPDEDSP